MLGLLQANWANAPALAAFAGVGYAREGTLYGTRPLELGFVCVYIIMFRIYQYKISQEGLSLCKVNKIACSHNWVEDFTTWFLQQASALCVYF